MNTEQDFHDWLEDQPASHLGTMLAAQILRMGSLDQLCMYRELHHILTPDQRQQLINVLRGG